MMGLSKRLADTLSQRSGRKQGYRPVPERLETRSLLTAIDLVNVAGPATGTGPGPYGVSNVGINSNGGAGYSVADVGDVNGDGYNDYLIGAPSITNSPVAPTLPSANPGNGQAYLVFGSQSANGQTIQNWLSLTSSQRIGDLAQLANTSQTNPITLTPTFPYNGVTFSSNQSKGLLGASVAAAGDVNGDGFNDFLIGAPGANTAYLVYGGQQLSASTNRTINLDNTTTNFGVSVITFTNSVNQLSTSTGKSLGTILNPIGGGTSFIAIGDPTASLNGLANNGGVYLISSNALRPATTQIIDLSRVGQGGSTNVPGVVFAGSNSGDNLGQAVAFAGDFNKDGFGDILLGATQSASGSGKAYLIYGSANLLNQSILTSGSYNINVGRVISTTTSTIPGVEFDGTSTGDFTGYSIATAMDFNGDGISDIMIGSPGWSSATGRVNIIMGQSAALTSTSLISGLYKLDSLPNTIQTVEFDGPAAGSLTGWSLSPIGKINTTLYPIAIGAPGFNNSQGQVYVLPGNPNLSGIYNLSNAQGGDIQGTVVTLSSPRTTNFLGSSVSGNVFFSASKTTDGDSLGDLVIGAAATNPTTSRNFAGAAFLVEGAFLPITNPVFVGITSPIGIDKASPPFAISLTATTMTVYIESSGSNTPGFAPYSDIDPNSIKVNGIPLPDPSTWTNAGDIDGDGIDDAKFTIPISSLGLTPGTATVTVTAKTLSTSPTPNRPYQGSAQVAVQSGGGGGGLPAANFGYGPKFQNFNAAAPIYGERTLPAINTLNRALWKPLPVSGVYQQFAAPAGFRVRQSNYFQPIKNKHHTSQAHGTLTLSAGVFTRGQFPNGVHFGPIIHKVPAIGAGQRYGYLPLRTR